VIGAVSATTSSAGWLAEARQPRRPDGSALHTSGRRRRSARTASSDGRQLALCRVLPLHHGARTQQPGWLQDQPRPDHARAAGCEEEGIAIPADAPDAGKGALSLSRFAELEWLHPDVTSPACVMVERHDGVRRQAVEIKRTHSQPRL
jgi:hypothetical protein